MPELVYGSASKAAAEKRASSNLAGSTTIMERGLKHEQEDEKKAEEDGRESGDGGRRSDRGYCDDRLR